MPLSPSRQDRDGKLLWDHCWTDGNAAQLLQLLETEMPNFALVLRRLLWSLVVGLPLLVVIYAVVMGGAALLAQLGDPSGALGLRWVGFIVAMLFVAGAVLLLLLLGWERISGEGLEE